MKYGLIMIVLALVLSGCIGQEDEATTTVVTSISTSTFETTIGTTVPETNVDGPVYDKCEVMSPIERDLCYLGIAVNTNNESLCGAINSDFRKEFCLNSTGVEIGGNSTIITGQLVNKFTGEGYPKILVELYGAANDTSPVTFDYTDTHGYYRFEVPGGDTYDIIVYFGKFKLKQTVKNAKRDNRYILDFIVK